MEMLWDSRVSDLETQVRDGPEKEGRHGKQEYEDLGEESDDEDGRRTKRMPDRGFRRN